MSLDPKRICRPLIVDAGLADRTPLVMARDAGLWTLHADRVARAARSAGANVLSTGGEPLSTGVITTAAPEPDVVVTVGDIEALLTVADDVDGPPAAFIAGRCDTGDPADLDALRALLRSVTGNYDPASPSSTSLLAVESAFSLALLGDVPSAKAVLQPMASMGGPRSTNDWLAAYYLAQLGDLSGYPLIVSLLGHQLGHYRLLAARHLAGFLPHDGEVVGDETIDVIGRLSERLDDDDSEVSVEVPGLLAEAGGEAVRPILMRAAESARDHETRNAAAWVLDRLTSRGAPDV